MWWMRVCMVVFFSFQFNCRAVAGCHFIRIYDMKWRQSFVYSNDQLNNQCRHGRCVLLLLLLLLICVMSVKCFFSLLLQLNWPNSSFQSMCVCVCACINSNANSKCFYIFIHQKCSLIVIEPKKKWSNECINRFVRAASKWDFNRFLCGTDDQINYYYVLPSKNCKIFLFGLFHKNEEEKGGGGRRSREIPNGNHFQFKIYINRIVEYGTSIAAGCKNRSFFAFNFNDSKFQRCEYQRHQFSIWRLQNNIIKLILTLTTWSGLICVSTPLHSMWCQ